MLQANWDEWCQCPKHSTPTRRVRATQTTHCVRHTCKTPLRSPSHCSPSAAPGSRHLSRGDTWGHAGPLTFPQTHTLRPLLGDGCRLAWSCSAAAGAMASPGCCGSGARRAPRVHPCSHHQQTHFSTRRQQTPCPVILTLVCIISHTLSGS